MTAETLSRSQPEPNAMVESILLVSVLADDSLLGLVATWVAPEDFYSLGHQAIFRTMLGLARKKERITLSTLQRELVDPTEQVNPIFDLVRLEELMPLLAVGREVIYDFINILRYRSYLRQLACIFEAGIADCAGGIHPLQIIDRLQLCLSRCKEDWNRPLKAQQQEQQRQVQNIELADSKMAQGRFDA
jgi:replicative DNA helicase